MKFFLVTIFLMGLSLQTWAQVRLDEPWVMAPSKAPLMGEEGHQESTSPVIVGDILYTAGMSGLVSAIDRKKGFARWTYQMPSGVDGALSYGRSLVVVGDISGNLVALHSRDGSLAWKIKKNVEWSAPPTIFRHLVLASTSQGEIYALNSRKKGEEVWQYSRYGDEKMTLRGMGRPSVFGTEVYQGFADGYMVALDIRTGEVRWLKSLRTRNRFYDVDFQAHLDEKFLWVASADGSLYCLDRLSGNTEWVFRVGALGGLLVEGDRLYFAGLNGYFYCLEKKQGTVIWKTSFEEGIGTRPTRVGDYLVFATSSDPFYILKATSGEVVYQGTLGAGTLAAPVSSGVDDWFYLYSNFGKLFSFRLEAQSMHKKIEDRIHTSSSAFFLSFHRP